MSVFSKVIQSVQSVAKRLTGGSTSHVVAKPVQRQPLAPLPTPTYQTLQPIQKAYTPAQFARNSSIMKNNSVAMQSNAAKIAQSQAVARANQERIEAARRETERRRKLAQDALNNAQSNFSSSQKLNVKNNAWKANNKKGDDAIKVKDSSGKDYDADYKKAYAEAMNEYYSKMNTGKQGLISKIWDKATFGQDRRQSQAREYAAKKAAEIGQKGTASYEKTLNKFLKDQATKKAAVENAKFSTQGDLDRAIAGYTSWESQEIAKLEKARARTTAQLEAFGSASSSKLTTKPSKTIGFIADKLKSFESNSWWKYTLGQGSKNAPSIVTAPSRVVNWLGNLNTKNRDIYQSGGTQINRSKSDLNAWQATQNQRNFNIRPVVDKVFDKAKAYEELINGKKTGTAFDGSLQQTMWRSKFSQAKGKDQLEIAKKYWDDRNRSQRNANSLQEFAADPLTIASAGTKLVSKLGLASKLSSAGRASKATSWAFKAADKLSSVKSLKWLGTEGKSATEKLADAVTAAKKIQGSAQQRVFPRINQLNKKLLENKKLDISVFDDLQNLSDSEAKVLQRMKGNSFAARDRLILAGRTGKLTRTKLEGIATKWQDFAEQMKLADNVESTRFSRGNKTYSPYTAWTKKKKKKYDFRKMKKRPRLQTKDDLYQGAVDRYFKSDLDSKFSRAQTSKKIQQKTERDLLLKQYDDAITPARAEVQKAEAKTKSAWERTKKVVGAPNRLWKKSVLKYRPAWTVNNILYNTQAGVLAGGKGALAEQAKMLNPRYWRKAMDESRDTFGGNLGKEIGKGRLNKFYQGVEDWSRVAAGRSALKKGISKEAAVKRVDKYLFDYKTKNWERPFRAVVPFWSFQKNLVKASASMPLDRPGAAIAYNRLDRHQQQSFEKDFSKVVKQLKDAGYSDKEIEDIKKEQAQYYAGKLKVGGKYVNTPFNAFSEKGMSSLGLNPWITAAGESVNSKDQWGSTIKGSKATLASRIASKFPQVDLGQQLYQTHQMRSGKKLPVEGWIGKPGSEGYGLGKQKQGYDSSKANYVRSIDPSAKLGQNALAFAGVPRTTQFDKDALVKRKVMSKVGAEYFSLDTKDLDYQAAEAKRQAVFKKYNITADDFYKGVLSKYDTDNTTNIKNQKASAATANKSLFDEYSKQPYGKKNLWAVNKLRELNASGYFDTNPFLKSFDWITPDKVARADRQAAYVKRGPSAKKIAYERAKKSGDWSAYRSKFGSSKKQSPFQHEGKFFKSAESMQKYKDGTFWRNYAQASKDDRKQMLADNPQYNKRAAWTAEQWANQKKVDKIKLKTKARSFGSFAKMMDEQKAIAQKKAIVFTRKTKTGKKVVYSR